MDANRYLQCYRDAMLLVGTLPEYVESRIALIVSEHDALLAALRRSFDGVTPDDDSLYEPCPCGRSGYEHYLDHFDEDGTVRPATIDRIYAKLCNAKVAAIVMAFGTTEVGKEDLDNPEYMIKRLCLSLGREVPEVYADAARPESDDFGAMFAEMLMQAFGGMVGGRIDERSAGGRMAFTLGPKGLQRIG